MRFFTGLTRFDILPNKRRIITALRTINVHILVLFLKRIFADEFFARMELRNTKGRVMIVIEKSIIDIIQNLEPE